MPEFTVELAGDILRSELGAIGVGVVGMVGAGVIALTVYEPFPAEAKISLLSEYAFTELLLNVIPPEPNAFAVSVSVYSVQTSEEPLSIAPEKEGFEAVGVLAPVANVKLHPPEEGETSASEFTVRLLETEISDSAALNACPFPFITTFTLNCCPTAKVPFAGVAAIVAVGVPAARERKS